MTNIFVPESVRCPVWLDLPPEFTKANRIILDPADKQAQELLKWTRNNPVWQKNPVAVEDREPVPYTPKFVAICGASGSGKDVFAQAVLQALDGGDGTIFEMDWYYGPGGLSPDGRPVCLCNFDHPGAIDLEYMLKAMKKIKAGYSVYTPRYNFAIHSRQKEHVIFPPSPVILVTGILILHAIATRPEFARLFDLCVAMDTPEPLWKKFRTQRDIGERKRDPENTRVQIEETVVPGYREFVGPYIEAIKTGQWKHTASITVSNHERQKLASGQPPSFDSKYVRKIVRLQSR